MFQAWGQHYCEGVIWQIQGTVKYISMWLSYNHVVRYHLLCQLHIELNSKACQSVNTVHMLNRAWSPLFKLSLPDFRFLTEPEWGTLFLPATLLHFPCIAGACIATSVAVVCVSVQLEERRKTSAGNFQGWGKSRRGNAFWMCSILLPQQIMWGKLNGFPPSAGCYTKSTWASESPFVPLYLNVCSKVLKLQYLLCKMEN